MADGHALGAHPGSRAALEDLRLLFVHLQVGRVSPSRPVRYTFTPCHTIAGHECSGPRHVRPQLGTRPGLLHRGHLRSGHDHEGVCVSVV